MEENFQTVSTIHIAVGNGGQKRKVKYLQTKYKKHYSTNGYDRFKSF